MKAVIVPVLDTRVGLNGLLFKGSELDTPIVLIQLNQQVMGENAKRLALNREPRPT